jgi:acetyl-CoA carboxylase beta subunit
VDWISFISGGLMTAFAYGLFTSDKEDAEEDENEDYEDEDSDEVEINYFKGKTAIMSCQTCRKLKKHSEVKPNLWQCLKCKRHTDLR